MTGSVGPSSSARTTRPRRSGRRPSRSLARFELPDDVVLPILKENLRHEDERVRLAVVDLLVERRALLPPLAPDLESLLTAEHDGVSRHAAFLLGKIGPDAAPLLLDALRREESRIDQIAEALAQIGRPVVGLLTRGASTPRSLASVGVRPWPWGRSAPSPRAPCRS